MRQAQHGRKPRGRGRKQHNPLSRIYDSNGPDTKIRGTAAHIAEKYQSLSRDAAVSGDRIASENYLQHAEHYLRIVAVAQASVQPVASEQQGQEDQTAHSVHSDGTESDDAADRGGEGLRHEQGAHQPGQQSARGRRGQNRRRHQQQNEPASAAPSDLTDVPFIANGPVGEAPPSSTGVGKAQDVPVSETSAVAAEPAGNGLSPVDAVEDAPVKAPRKRTRKKPAAEAADHDASASSSADAPAADAV